MEGQVLIVANVKLANEYINKHSWQRDKAGESSGWVLEKIASVSRIQNAV